jgi:hypothetical protein
MWAPIPQVDPTGAGLIAYAPNITAVDVPAGSLMGGTLVTLAGAGAPFNDTRLASNQARLLLLLRPYARP